MDHEGIGMTSVSTFGYNPFEARRQRRLPLSFAVALAAKSKFIIER
jgi:hypothetical protein